MRSRLAKLLVTALTTLAVLGGFLCTTVAPASAATTVKSHCEGTVVTSCVQVRRTADGKRLYAWARIRDRQTDASNYTVWIDRIQLDYGCCTGISSGVEDSYQDIDADGRHTMYDTATVGDERVCRYSGGGHGTMIVRAMARLRWVRVGSTQVGKRWVTTGWWLKRC